MAKFDNAKVGDRVWSSVYGWGKIVNIDDEELYPIVVHFSYESNRRYTYQGYYRISRAYPELFWNEFHIPNEEEDKKPFELLDFLKSKICKSKFIYGEKNYIFSYNHDYRKTEILTRYFNTTIGAKYFRPHSNNSIK